MIHFNEKSKTFYLGNNEISYIFKIMQNGQLEHLYFGKKVDSQVDVEHLRRERACIGAPDTFENNLDFSLDVLRQEYPAYGAGDYREPAYQLRMGDGSRITDFVYKSHRIYKGKEKLPGLPCTFGEEGAVSTLEITLEDAKIGCKLLLNYHVFENLNVIARSACFQNDGAETLHLERALSMSIDLFDADYDMLQLDGAWGRERHVHTRSLQYGKQSISSARGASSAFHNPFFALKTPHTTEKEGEVYGFALIYSGNFLAQAEVDHYDVTRVSLGINPFEFEWKLETGESFHTPEAVMVYADEGLNGMSRTFHSLFRNHLMKSEWGKKVRPILINNWEATYFDFTEEKILSLAAQAKQLGIELFVLDDGWFGKRNDDTSSLGDWEVNPAKLPGGIDALATKITAMGLLFGLWFEPEMVNEISELYKLHPEWAVCVPGRKRTLGRNQMVLDYANPAVVEHIYEKMAAILDCGKISYVKWDMNRYITEAYSAALPADRQKEFFHRYILGVYALYEKLTTRFPHILFESCASGGGRFDPGLLYYAPQGWTSDDTDAVERLKIQYGTSMLYPIASMGSHVSAVPNHQVGRTTSLKTRADTAYFGTFGYELDITSITDEEKEEMKAQIAYFKKNREVFQLGEFYRLQNEDDQRVAWMCVAEDGKKAIVAAYKVLATPNPKLRKIKLQGLNPNKQYLCEETGQTYYGDELMHFGLICETEFTGYMTAPDYQGVHHAGTDMGDFTSQLYTFTEVEE